MPIEIVVDAVPVAVACPVASVVPNNWDGMTACLNKKKHQLMHLASDIVLHILDGSRIYLDRKYHLLPSTRSY